MAEIQSAVGRQPALNSVRDQQIVQDLLNRITPNNGGPLVPLQEPIRPNFVSRTLQEAITRFQNQNVELPKRDGRVDRIGQTITKLNELANGNSPTPATPKKQTTFHSKPVAPQNQNPPIEADFHPHIVQEFTKDDDQARQVAAYRKRIRDQLRGNPNAPAVEAFLNSRTKSSSTGFPVLENSFLFGTASLDSQGEKNHNGTAMGGVGTKVSTSSDNDNRPVILFLNANGASVLGPGTLIVILDNGERPAARVRAEEGTRVMNGGELRKRLGEIAGDGGSDNREIPLQ
jgi:hypothetical protein